jgi:hypothetical protein
MALNFYSFLIGSTLAEKEFNAKGVPNTDRARQLGIIASIFSPTNGGGFGSSVLPAVLVQQTARREAEVAAAAAAPPTTTGGQNTLDSNTTRADTPPASPDIVEIKNRLTAVEATLADYPSVLTTPPTTVEQAQIILKEFYVIVEGQTPENTAKSLKVKGQIPVPAQVNSKLARGATVRLTAG